MRLDCYVLKEDPPALVAGEPGRDWMDAFNIRFPYRCLPLVMANTSGWEIRCPVAFEAEWDGDTRPTAITVSDEGKGFAIPHFGGGILTFHTGYLFRTPPGWALWTMGPPNHVKDGIQALTALVETDWLPFPFTMNWQMTRPGRIRFERNEPFCFITPSQHYKLDDVDPVVRSLADNPELKTEYEAWREKRTSFLERHAAGDPETLRQIWEKRYFDGRPPEGGGPRPEVHVRKRRLAQPRKE